MSRQTPVIAIRCDGNAQLASGHLMRCLSIAGELAKRGAEVFFCFADEESERWFRGKEFPREILRSDFRDPRGELPVLAECLRKRQADAILIDHYHVDDSYLAELKERDPELGICVLDDFLSSGRPADLMINYTLPGRAADTPLRQQFREHRMSVRPKVQRIFVSTGGSDPCGMREALTVLLKEILPEAEICIPQGIEEMAAYMASCDLAVSAGGTTVYELCAVGVPTILFTMADNQQVLAESVKNAVENAGDVRSEAGKRYALKKIGTFITMMAGDIGLRTQTSERMKQMTDGHGAERIADRILGLIRSSGTRE